MIKYKTYCNKIPKHFNKTDIIRSSVNKPFGKLLWGCRGDEWKEWCESEDFCLAKLKKSFKWRLKRGSKILRIKTVQDYINLCLKYGDYEQIIGTINYSKVAKDYDAVELVGNIVYKVRYGLYFIKSIKRYKKYIIGKNSDIIGLGLSAWDVPSICVFNANCVIKL